MPRQGAGLITASLITTSLTAAALLIATSFALAQTPSWSPPPDNARCPSKWGAGDERGSGNHMKPVSVLNAVKLIKSGEVIELGQVLNESIPIQRTRRFEMFTKPTGPALGSNNRRSNEELVVAEIGQVGTQFDGFAHQTHGNSLYNCLKLDDVMTRTGFTKLGIHQVGALITRGVLIDVAGYKGVEMLGDTYEITVADLEGALKKQNTTLQAGDAVIIHTGWGKLFGKDNARYMKSNPGIGVKAGEWLIAKDPMLLGSDNTPVEVAPPADPMLSGPIHQMALVVYGVHLLEHMKLDELAAKGVYEFAFMMQPLKLQGATGSTVAPIAVR
jgi:kynurenine formamidase